MLETLKDNWKKKDNGLIQIIIINLVVFAVLGLLYVISKLFQYPQLHYFFTENLVLSSNLGIFITKPWTIFTYFFSHQGLFHVVFNLLSLYWFGNVIVDLIGNRRLVNIYIMGGLFAGVVYLLLFNLVPFFINMSSSGLIGASGAIYAVAVGAAVLAPDYTFHLIFFGPVKIKYLAGAMIFISILGSVDTNAGGNVAHLGGALMGYLYMRALKNGTDLGKPISKTIDYLTFWKNKSTLSVSHKNTKHHATKNFPHQSEVDIILDKINKSGYESLSKEEKQKLFKASQK